MNTADIERILGHAPRPKPPGILRQQLKAQALRAPRLASAPPPSPREPGSWLSRWWPALAPAAVSLACAAVLTSQHAELQRLKSGGTQSAKLHSSRTITRAEPVSLNGGEKTALLSPSEQEELVRLRAQAANLSSEVSKLEQMRLNNNKLRQQLAAASAAQLSPEEADAVEKARSRAMSIACVNNLKQLGLAVRIWANENGDMTPPDIVSMSNEIGGAFKILVCPADTGRQAARDLASYTPANCSYEYLAPSAPLNEPNRIMFRCPIHGTIGLCDGSVQMEVAKNHPEQIIQQGGKLYFGQPPNSAAPQSAQPAQSQ